MRNNFISYKSLFKNYLLALLWFFWAVTLPEAGWFVEFFVIVAYYDCNIRLVSLKNNCTINLNNKIKQALSFLMKLLNLLCNKGSDFAPFKNREFLLSKPILKFIVKYQLPSYFPLSKGFRK